jgi:hypothetical protein
MQHPSPVIALLGFDATSGRGALHNHGGMVDDIIPAFSRRDDQPSIDTWTGGATDTHWCGRFSVVEIGGLASTPELKEHSAHISCVVRLRRFLLQSPGWFEIGFAGLALSSPLAEPRTRVPTFASRWKSSLVALPSAEATAGLVTNESQCS